MLNRGALTLLNAYGSDSSDDEVPGPRVSTKRTHKDSDDDYERGVKKLPLPSIINTRLNGNDDDPQIHGGRIRSFPHEQGNWATYVYIPYETNLYIKELVESLKQSSSINLNAVDHYHISLTRTVVLRHHWIDLFVQSIKERIGLIRRFLVMFDSLKVYCNDERTRTFIGVRIKTGFDSLLGLVEVLDGCLSQFKLPCFYKNPSFHMSIAWCLGDREVEINKILPELNDTYYNLVGNSPEEYWYICVNQIQCKIGNKLFTIPV